MSTDVDWVEDTAPAEPEGLAQYETISLLGREFRVADSMGLMALMKFAHFAKSGARTSDMGAMDALYSVLQSTIHPDHWEEFVDFAIEVRADQDALLGAVREAIAVMSARPTKSPGGSPAGRLSTETSSLDGLFSEDSSIPDDDISWLTYQGGQSALLSDPRVRELVPVTTAARRTRT